MTPRRVTTKRRPSSRGSARWTSSKRICRPAKRGGSTIAAAPVRRLLRLAIAAAAIALPAAAQTFPERPLRIVVAFSTGTAADIVARQIALKLTDAFGKQVV